MKRYRVYYKVIGYATAEVEAATDKDALRQAKGHNIVYGTEHLQEWEFDDVCDVEPVEPD